MPSRLSGISHGTELNLYRGPSAFTDRMFDRGLRLGEEFHYNRLTLIASIGAWGAPHRHAPLWDRRRVMATAVRLLSTDHVAVDGLLGRRSAFADARAAFDWIDRHPQGAVKVALTY